MKADESRARHSGRRVMAVLFLPRTLQGRLAFLGLIMFLALALAPSSVSGWVGWALFAVLIWAWVVAVRDRRRRNKRLTVHRALAVTGVVILGYLAFIGVFLIGTWALATLATSGSLSWSSALPASSGDYQFEAFLALVIVGTLVWVPQRLFTIKIDMDGNEGARRILLGLITAAASVLTGIYIVMLHFGGGQVSKIHLGALVAGMVFTVVLVAPFYRSWARACWQYGISGMFSLRTLRRHWGEALTEVEKSLNQAAELGRASSNDLAPEVRKAIPGQPHGPRPVPSTPGRA